MATDYYLKIDCLVRNGHSDCLKQSSLGNYIFAACRRTGSGLRLASPPDQVHACQMMNEVATVSIVAKNKYSGKAGGLPHPARGGTKVRKPLTRVITPPAIIFASRFALNGSSRHARIMAMGISIKTATTAPLCHAYRILRNGYGPAAEGVSEAQSTRRRQRQRGCSASFNGREVTFTLIRSPRFLNGQTLSPFPTEAGQVPLTHRQRID